MADFGWAYVKGNLLSASAPPSGAVQFNDGENQLAASGDLIFISGSTSQLNLTGTLNVSGAINANQLNVNVTNRSVINLTSTGSTTFGDTSEDLHRFTGSVDITENVSASAFYGDGSNLTNIVAAPAGANTQIQFNNSSNLGASSNLTFVNDTLTVGGDITASLNISASGFYGDGSNLTGITTNPAGSDKQIQFNNSNNFGASSNFVFDSGKVGIGTNTPAQKLTIDTGNIQLTNGYQLQWGDADTAIFGNASSDYVRVKTAGLDRFAIDSTGKVGIGTINPDHNLSVVGDISASINISASAFYGDGSNLTGIATTLQAVTNNGNTTTNALTASALKLEDLEAGTALNTNFLALDSSNNVVLTSSSGGNSTMIGEAEDGAYTDGLFSDFSTSTLIGTAIDRFNEILKIIVPGPAPSVDRINYTNPSGIQTKITYDAGSVAPSGYATVGTTGSFSSALSINDQYTVATSGEDFRLGVYDGDQQITGTVNFHVTEEFKSSELNYSNNAFGNAESGSLKLIVNGATVHTLNLTASGAGNPNSGSASDFGIDGSGFFDISLTGSATDQNGSKYNIFQHRTAKYVIDPEDQTKGWNYAKIEHEFGNTTYVTNFVQWFNDSDAFSNAMATSNTRVSFTGVGSKYLSGVEYFRSANLVYNSDVSNVYKFTYPTGNVLTFNRTSNVNVIPADSLDATDGTQKFNKIFEITGSTATNNNTMLDDSTTISVNLEHPLKANLSAAGSITTSGILIYNVDTANTNLIENFDLEDFRITTQNYDNQSSVTDSSAVWNSEHHLTGGGATGHTDGLIMYNGALRSHLQGANGGNFSTLANGPSGNPNYAGILGTRAFYRKIQNTESDPIRDIKITSTKNTRYRDDTLLSNNVKFSIKVPGSTAWLDISQPFSYGVVSNDGDGALISSATDNSNTGVTDSGTSVHCVTFGTASILNGQHAVIKVEADESWTGNISQLQFQLGASDSGATPAATPDPVGDLNLTDNAGVEAKLSFGGDNTVVDYSKVGGIGTLDPVNVNELFADDSDVTRGVFGAFETMGGTINPTASNGASNAFHNGFTGSLILNVNGTEYGEINLASSRNASSSIASNTGLSVSAVNESQTSDGIPDFRLHYRTGTYSVGTSHQRLGWNYARVIHRVGGVDTTTNYVQWVVDTSSSINATVSDPTLTNFNHDDVYYQSGVGYFASNPSASFSFSGSNYYNNVYQNGNAISFPLVNSVTVNSITGSGDSLTTLSVLGNQMAMPALDETDDCELTNVVVTSSVTYSGGTSIKDSLSLFDAINVRMTGRINHPLKSGTFTTSEAAKNSFMVHSGTIGSSNQSSAEFFGLETYRIVSGNYPNQTDLTSLSNKWNSQTQINNGGSHDDGMVTVNGYLISPLKIGNSGDTRNLAEAGGSGLQAPAGNPNYSSVTNDIRSFYRVFRFDGDSATPNLTLSIRGDATLRSMDASYPNYYEALTASGGTNKNVNVEIRVSTDSSASPDQSTTWLDCGKIIIDEENKQSDVGAGVRSGAHSGEDVTIDTNGLNITLDLGTSRLIPNQYYVIKVSAHKNWTGYISRIQVVYG